MRKLIYCILLIIAVSIPMKKLDIAKLMPVEAIAIYKDNGNVILVTDTEHYGAGDTVEQAVADLKENTTQIIYLDTAKYLLVAEDAQEEAKKLLEQMKKSIQVIGYSGGNVKEEAQYYDAHNASAEPDNNE